MLGAMTPEPAPRRPWWQGTPMIIGLVVAALGAGAALWFAATSKSNTAAPSGTPAPTSKAPTPLEEVAYTCSLHDDAIADNGTTLSITTDGDESSSPYNYGDVTCIASYTEMPTSVRRQIETTRALDGMQRAKWGHYSAFWNYHPDSGLNLTISDKS